MASIIKSPSTAEGSDWSTPNNIFVSDNSHARRDNLNPGETSGILTARNFGFTIPDGSAIAGVEVKVEVHWYNWQASFETVKLTKANGISIGDNLANGVALNSVDTIHTFGGSTSLWGAGLSILDINNNPYFGVHLQFKNHNTGKERASARVDHIQITVHYREESGLGMFTKVSSTIKNIDKGYTKVGGVWKPVEKSLKKVSGTWKE